MTSIKCKIDMPEAIRRGFNCSERETVAVNVEDLPFKARDVLAANLVGGNFKSPETHIWPELPEPSQRGLQEVLTRMLEEAEPKGVR